MTDTPDNCGRCSKPKGKGEDCCKCGRPLKFGSVEELQEKIDAYFADCDPHPVERENWVVDEATGEISLGTEKILTKQKPYTVTGLAVWLDTTRETLIDYEEREEFSDTIRAAKQKIEAFQESCLYDKDYPTNGVKFSMANNYDWKEKTETDHKVKKDAAAELANAMMGTND